MGIGGAGDTAHESFWFPRRRGRRRRDGSGASSEDRSAAAGLAAGSTSGTGGGRAGSRIEDEQEGERWRVSEYQQEEDEEEGMGAFFSFRVANRDNEVGRRGNQASAVVLSCCSFLAGLSSAPVVL